MTEKDGTWRCSVCQAQATIEGQNIAIVLPPSFSLNWPRHSDCELAKMVDDIDISKLEKIG